MDEDDFEWRFVLHEDYDAVSKFVCADPPKPYKSASTGWKPWHPRRWEFDAQQTIRGLASRHSFPTRPPTRIFIARDQEGLAGVVSWTELQGPGDVHIDVAGVALRYRRQRGVFARMLANRTLSEIEAAAIEVGAPELYMEGEIYSMNDASQMLASDKGFRLHEAYPSGAQTWNYRLPLGDAATDLTLPIEE